MRVLGYLNAGGEVEDDSLAGRNIEATPRTIALPGTISRRRIMGG